MHRITVIDTHTGGEPTRVVTGGGPPLTAASVAERQAQFATEFDHYRRAIVNEPRGSDVLVGALVCPPSDPTCAAGVIFFNNVGMIGMCGHGTIGLAAALGHAGQIHAGSHRIETSVGVITIEYDGRNRCSIENVPAYRHRAGVTVSVPGIGPVTGDVAWGGNWFFLVSEHGLSLEPDRCESLIDITWRIRQALSEAGITGAEGAEIDHVELFGPPKDERNHSRNFVLCPGKAYDRSPCGTGTSAKIACLAADGKWAPEETWRQESIVGSLFEASYRIVDGRCIPRITGSAFVTGENTLLVDPNDPFAWGLVS